MTEDNGQEILTQKPIQVRKVSQLPNFMEYLNNTEYSDEDGNPLVTLDKGFFMVSYPSNNPDIPHNYKIRLQDFGGLILAYVEATIKEIWEHIKIIEKHIKEEDGDTIEGLEYYWNLYGESINNNLHKIAPWSANNEDYEKLISKWNDIIEDLKCKGIITGVSYHNEKTKVVI